jgi:hypothetical protein
VFLSPKDRQRFSEYEASLRTELAVYLGEHARREGYVLSARPKVLFETDTRLSVGEFGIACEIVSPDNAVEEPEPEAQPAPAAQPEPAPVPVPVTPPPAPDPAVAVAEAEPEPESATAQFSAAEAAEAGGADLALLVDGRRIPVGETLVLGRSSGCDIVLDDANASRRHAEVRRRGDAATIVDLDSTNGTAVNGRRVREQALSPGDKITIGTTTLVFERK